MSIFIRGMEMPKAGQLLQVAENVDGTIFIRETTQGEWHQVVEVPTPHGRLIDADLMVLTHTKGSFDISRVAHHMPTVIEAEE